MNVTLYYVEGISRIDTPYFATKTTQASLEKQEEFFTSKIVKTIQLSYYPPHYRNAIRFDEDDLTINDNVNYLSLDYKGKKYYYFIDNINYISESLIEVEITMDVIQTYMFDIYIANGIIERKFIDRWNGANINRNYIRENVSRNEYVYYNSHIINSDTSQWLVFATTTKYYNSNYTTTKISYDKTLPGSSNSTSYVSSYPFYIMTFEPSRGATVDIVYTESDAGTFNKNSIPGTNSFTAVYDNFNFLATRNWVSDIFICPFNCAQDLVIAYNYGTSRNEVTLVDMPYTYFYNQLHSDYSPPDLYNMITLGNDQDDPEDFDRNFKNVFNCKVGSYQLNNGLMNLGKNTVKSTAYNSRYITQMLDENYIRFKYGTLTSFTSIPLFYLLSDYVYCYYAFMPSDGTRLYWIGDSNGVDTYNTVIQDTNILHYDLKNDPWVNYQSQNRSRYVAAGLHTAVDIFTKGMTSGLSNKFATQEIMDIKSNPKSYDRRYKEPKLKTKPASMVMRREQEMERNDMSSLMGAIGSFDNGIVGQAFTDVNIATQPATPKQIANISSVCAKQAYIMTYVEHVNDYEQCAQYYHRNGFLVNEYINAKDDIFGYVFNRYYFNVLKMQLPNVHLHNVIEDEDTIQAITDRLVDGLRLWNVMYNDVSLGDFQYDNVELLYL